MKQTDDEVVCRILSVDPNCEAIRSAANHRRRFEEAAEELFRNDGGVNDCEGVNLGDFDDDNGVHDSYSEGEDSDAGLP